MNSLVSADTVPVCDMNVPYTIVCDDSTVIDTVDSVWRRYLVKYNNNVLNSIVNNY